MRKRNCEKPSLPLSGSLVSQSCASCVAVSSICAAPFSYVHSTQVDTISRKLATTTQPQFPRNIADLKQARTEETDV
jgi:hypothetical protein